VDIDELVKKIVALPQDWHGAGTVNAVTMRAIAKYIALAGPLKHTIETGSGRTTLLFSHMSPDHRVFALDAANSVSAVRSSPLFKSDGVTFVDGPTQLTMPTYNYPESIQVALIDGPHGYPFPDIEYYYLYPRIATGGILMVDDILIPTIHRMFEVIAADPMFDLLEVINSNLAIFRRTAAPAINPTGDDWWLQGYNLAHYQKIQRGSVKQRLVDAVAKIVPPGLKDAVPTSVKKAIWKTRSS
jgi:Methyltransferase domain